MICNTLKIQRICIFQGSRISISTFHNIALKNGAHHHNIQNSPTLPQCPTFLIWTRTSHTIKTINMIPLDTIFPGTIMITLTFISELL
jgi:hypothetical protein